STTLKGRLKELDAKEERLVDLAADDELPQDKIKARLRTIRAERANVEESLAAVGSELTVGVEVLSQALDLLSDPHRLYEEGTDAIRRHLNQAFYERFYLDIQGVGDDQLKEPFADLHHAAGTRQVCHHSPAAAIRPRRDRRNEKGGPTVPEVLSDPGSSKTALVELPGIEPGSSAASSGLLRVQFAMPLLGSLGHANKPR
ncbi:integrase, partial [Nocardia seriolae]